MHKSPFERPRITAEEAVIVAGTLKQHLQRLGINPGEVIAYTPGLSARSYNSLLNPEDEHLGVVHEYPIAWIRKFIRVVDAIRDEKASGKLQGGTSGIEDDPIIAAILEREKVRPKRQEKLPAKPRRSIVPAEELPAIAETLKHRIAQLDATIFDISRRGISPSTLTKMLSGKKQYRHSQLRKLQDVLDDLEQEKMSPDGLQAAKITQQAVWGDKMRMRREELGLTLETLGEHIGITKERLRQMEAGLFSPGKPRIKDLLTALGYPRTDIDTLDNDTPQLPTWVEKYRQENHATANVSLDKKLEIGGAVETLRAARGISAESLGQKLGYTRMRQMENGHYSDEALAKTLAAFRLKDADQLIDYINAHGIEPVDMAAHQKELELLYAASRILRTHWNITVKEMQKYCAADYKISAGSIASLENPNHPFGKKIDPSLEMVIGVIAALYNADGQQLRKYQLLHELPNVRRIADIAHKGQSLTYGKHVKQLLGRAIHDIIDTALEVENGVYEPAPPKSKDKRAAYSGLHHHRNTDHRSLAEMVAQFRNGNNSLRP